MDTTSAYLRADLDSLDAELLAVLEREFVFTGTSDRESSMMLRAHGKEKNLRNAAEHGTGWVTAVLAEFADKLGIDPTLIYKHRSLVVPDYRFGAASRLFKGRPYILINAGCMHLLSYLSEVDVIGMRLLRERRDSLTSQLYTWLVGAGTAVAVEYVAHPFALPKLRQFMDDEMNFTEACLLSSAELFVFFHEVGHIEMGHIGNGFGMHADQAMAPNCDEEFAADRYAVDLLLEGGAGAVQGVKFMFESLRRMEVSGMQMPAGSTSLRSRIDALGVAFPDIFNLKTPVGPGDSQSTPTTPVRAAPDIETARLLWTCGQIVRECAIDVPQEHRAAKEEREGPEYTTAGVHSLVRAAEILKDNATIHNTIARYLRLGDEWKYKRAFIEAQPELLSEEADSWFQLEMMSEEKGGDSHNFLTCERVLLHRCREVGVEHSLPIKDVLAAIMQATSLEAKGDLLRAHPHVLCDAAKIKAEKYYAHLNATGNFEVARLAIYARELIAEARRNGIDVGLDHVRNAPDFPSEVSLLAMRLDRAQSTGNLLEQFQICEAALELASMDAASPTWSLVFREHLQSLPDF